MTVRIYIYRSARIKSVFITEFRQNCGDGLLDVESRNIARYKAIKVLFRIGVKDVSYHVKGAKHDI